MFFAPRLNKVLALAVTSALAIGVMVPDAGAHAFSSASSLPKIAQTGDLVITVAATDGEVDAARSFIDGMAQRAINFLADQSMSQDQKSKQFQKLLADSFDLKTIGRFALGRYWRVASPAQQTEYLKLFEKMVVDVYSNRFKDYQGQDLVVDSAKPEGDKDVMVTSYIVPDSGSKVRVDWRVRDKDGRQKIVDIIVEGVSMAVTQRSEFSSVIQAGGGDVAVLLDHLRK